ncbi:hypothetical protein NDU88_006347 [Pleurodeles waltl]|uniref:Uncharacterized protein n=1 Tax=Pleurodeles waltl TaxID=8319 RepID=A0AAV7QHC7_PLEWA|nr:hypothetical protein NDU88_006347 [Pleurodeles waltl]
MQSADEMRLTAWPTGCGKAETACDWWKTVSHRAGCLADLPRERSLGCKECGAEMRGRLNQRYGRGVAREGPPEWQTGSRRERTPQRWATE